MKFAGWIDCTKRPHSRQDSSSPLKPPCAPAPLIAEDKSKTIQAEIAQAGIDIWGKIFCPAPGRTGLAFAKTESGPSTPNPDQRVVCSDHPLHPQPRLQLRCCHFVPQGEVVGASRQILCRLPCRSACGPLASSRSASSLAPYGRTACVVSAHPVLRLTRQDKRRLCTKMPGSNNASGPILRPSGRR